MVESYVIFNVVIYLIVVAYILYINFSAYYNRGTKLLEWLVKLNQSWIFRTIYLLVVGFFALDYFPWGGFTLAILLTIAFLNTNMLMYKKNLNEHFSGKDKPKCLPFNPLPYRPDENLLVPGFPDPLPKNVMKAPESQSGIGYQFEMA